MNRPIGAMTSMASLAILLAACGGGDASPSDAASADPTTAASEPASEAPGASESASEEPEAEEASVTLEGFAFDTDELTIAAGSEVSFVNADSAEHTVTEGTDGTAAADPIIDDRLAANATTSFTFDEPGTYEITCVLHPDMNMTITVEG